MTLDHDSPEIVNLDPDDTCSYDIDVNCKFIYFILLLN